MKKLDAMFDFDNSKLDYSHAEDIAGLIGQYIHGNEPSHHVAYMYDYAGAPWRTQARRDGERRKLRMAASRHAPGRRERRARTLETTEHDTGNLPAPADKHRH